MKKCIISAVLLLPFLSLSAFSTTVVYQCPSVEQLTFKPYYQGAWFVTGIANPNVNNAPELSMSGISDSNHPTRLIYSEMFPTDGFMEFLCHYEYINEKGQEDEFYIAEDKLTHLLDHCHIPIGHYMACHSDTGACELTCDDVFN